ncbi:MAG: hypothetical protein ABSE05_15625 [Syntrophales bacterium]|jgi:hypothetical protein
MKISRQRGFLVLEILIAGLILTASIAATMYLFRMGYEYLERANQSNVLSSKLIETVGLLKTLELEKQSGVEDMGDGVNLKWGAQLLGLSRPMIGDPEFRQPSLHELRLYRVDFVLDYQGVTRSYQVSVFRYKPLSAADEIFG